MSFVKAATRAVGHLGEKALVSCDKALDLPFKLQHPSPPPPKAHAAVKKLVHSVAARKCWKGLSAQLVYKGLVA